MPVSVNVCVCVCVCVCLCVCVCAFIHMCMHVCMYVCICVFCVSVGMCVSLFWCVCVSLCVHACLFYPLWSMQLSITVIASIHHIHATNSSTPSPPLTSDIEASSWCELANEFQKYHGLQWSSSNQTWDWLITPICMPLATVLDNRFLFISKNLHNLKKSVFIHFRQCLEDVLSVIINDS